MSQPPNTDYGRRMSNNGLNLSTLVNRRESLTAPSTPVAPSHQPLSPRTPRAPPKSPEMRMHRSIDLKRGSIDYLASDALLLKEASRRSQRALPRSATCFHRTAMAGWALAVILLMTLVVSHSTLTPEIKRVDLSHLPHHALDLVGKAAFDAVRGNHDLAEYNPIIGGLQSTVTIVSSFYRIDTGKKHSVSDYHNWLTTFFGTVEQPIVFYCAPALRDYVQGLRGSKPITIITEWETPFEMPPLENLGGRAWADNQHKIDPEQVWHVPDVYGIWTAKPWIVKHAKDLDPYHSEYFFWVDAGAFREDPNGVKHDLNDMPRALDKLYADAGLPDDTLVLSATSVPFDEGTTYVKSVTRGKEMDRVDILQGGWYGGKKGAIDWWERETMKVTVLQAALQRFAAKEQPVWTQAAALNWQKIYVQNMALAKGECGKDLWFTFLYFADGRDCTVPAWNGPQYARLEAEEDVERARVAGMRGKAAKLHVPDVIGMVKQLKKGAPHQATR